MKHPLGCLPTVLDHGVVLPRDLFSVKCGYRGGQLAKASVSRNVKRPVFLELTSLVQSFVYGR